MTGTSVGYWQVGERFLVSSGTKGKRKSQYLCTCACGLRTKVWAESLVRGQSRSCGCRTKEFMRAAKLTHGKSKVGSRAYRTWTDLRARCHNPKAKAFKHYGGRGIAVCPRWDKFENFYEDMGDPPPRYSIERINVNGNYSPENCMWIPLSDQNKNTTRSLKNREKKT